jgi:hypothetical protein
MNCYFCLKPVGDKYDNHHPDKAQFPDWTEPAHPKCHHDYHLYAGHFKDWGSLAPYAGRPGYERCLKKWPGFHVMGGKTRARTAQRNALGQFV